MHLTLDRINIGKYPDDKECDVGGHTVFGKVNTNFATVEFQLEQLTNQIRDLTARVSRLESRGK